MAARDRLSVSLRTSIIAESSAVLIYVSVKLARLNIFSSVVSRFLFYALFVQNLSLIFNNYSLNAFTDLDIGAIVVNNLAIIELLF